MGYQLTSYALELVGHNKCLDQRRDYLLDDHLDIDRSSWTNLILCIPLSLIYNITIKIAYQIQIHV